MLISLYRVKNKEGDMKIIRSKKSIGWLSNQRSLNPPKLYSTKGLTKVIKSAIVTKQLEFNFMRAS